MTWHADRLAQWDRVKDAIPGLQLTRTGRDKGTYIIRCSVGDFEQAALLGRPQMPLQARAGVPTRPEIVMGDGMLADVIACWREGRKAHLPAMFNPRLGPLDLAALSVIRKREHLQRQLDARRNPKADTRAAMRTAKP